MIKQKEKTLLIESSLEVLPLKIAGCDAKPLAVPDAVLLTAVVVPNPNNALVPPKPPSLAVAVPLVIANLPTSILEAVVVSVTPTAPSASIFSPVVALFIVNLFKLELYETVTP